MQRFFATSAAVRNLVVGALMAWGGGTGLSAAAAPAAAAAVGQPAVAADGGALFRAGRWAEAEQAFFAVLKSDPQDLTAIAGAGLAAFQQGKREAAQSRLAQGVARFAESDPELNDVRAEPGKGHLSLLRAVLKGRIDSSVVEFGTFGGMANPDAAYFAGLTALDEGEADLAAKLFREAVAGDPGRYPAVRPAEEKLAALRIRLKALEPDDAKLAVLRFQIERARAAGDFGTALAGAKVAAERRKDLPTYPARVRRLAEIQAEAERAKVAAAPTAQSGAGYAARAENAAELVEVLKRFWSSEAAEDGDKTGAAEKAWRRLHEIDPLWPASQLAVPLDRWPEGALGEAVRALVAGPVPLKNDVRFRAVARVEPSAWDEGPSAAELGKPEVRERAAREARTSQVALLLELLTTSKTAGTAADLMLVWLKQDAFADPAGTTVAERLGGADGWAARWGLAGTRIVPPAAPSLWMATDRTAAEFRPAIERLMRLVALAMHGPALSKGRTEVLMNYLWTEAKRLEAAAGTGEKKLNPMQAGPADYVRHAVANVLLLAASRVSRDGAWVQDVLDWDRASGLADQDWRTKAVAAEANSAFGKYLGQLDAWAEGKGARPETQNKSFSETPAVLLRLLKLQWAGDRSAGDAIAFYRQQRTRFPWALSLQPSALAWLVQSEAFWMANNFRISDPGAQPSTGARALERLEKITAFEAALGEELPKAQRTLFAGEAEKARKSIDSYIAAAKTRAPTLAESTAADAKSRAAAERLGAELLGLMKPLISAGNIAGAISTLRTYRNSHRELENHFGDALYRLEQQLVAADHREFMARQARQAGERFEQNERIAAESAAAAEQRRTSAPGYKPSWDEQWAELVRKASEQAGQR